MGEARLRTTARSFASLLMASRAFKEAQAFKGTQAFTFQG